MTMELLLLLMSITANISLSTAQTTSSTSSIATASSTSSAAGTIHTIDVGAAGFSFSPQSITADVGDIVRFNFYPTNHSVARAEFKYPCIPYEYVYTGRTGFWSEFMPVQAILNPPPSYSIRINDTEPIFFYCSAAGACLDDVMIGAINPNETFSLEIQKEFVANSTFELSPGEPFPKESPSPDPTMPGGYASASSARGSSSNSAASLSGGAIAGIAIGGTALVMLGGTLMWWCGRKGGIEKGFRQRNTTTTAALHPHPPHPHSCPHPSPSPAVMEAKYNNYTPRNSPPQPPSPPVSQSLYGGHDTYRSAATAEWGQSSHGPYQQPPSGFASTPKDGHEIRGYYDLPKLPSPPPQPPVELPTSADPGNSPLPGYSNNMPLSFSWRGGAVNRYRPGKG